MNSPSRLSLPSDSRLQPLYPFILSEHPSELLFLSEQPSELLFVETLSNHAEVAAEKAQTPHQTPYLLYAEMEVGGRER